MTDGDNNAAINEPFVKKLMLTIGNKELPFAERDAAKNELILAHAAFIMKKLLRLTGGHVGICDRPTELFNSAYVRLKEDASEIAKAAESHSVIAVVAHRLRCWAVDKIRRSDGQTVIRGKGRKIESITSLAIAEGCTSPDDEVALAQVKAAVFSAVAELDDVEQAVVLSFFGLDGPRMSMREVADLIGISLSEAYNAQRRARDKLRSWLKEHRDI